MLILLSLLTLANIGDTEDAVVTLRSESVPGIVELSTGVAISPRHCITVYRFASSSLPYISRSDEVLFPDSAMLCPDLGLALLRFPEDVFDHYQLPSEDLPEVGEPLALVGQGLTGITRVDARTIARHPDGAFLIATDRREGLMGAAAFDPQKGFVGMITGITTVTRGRHPARTYERLVLLPSQIWHLWAQLAIFEQDYSRPSFGVTAIAYAPPEEQNWAPPGVHLLAVEHESHAWDSGLRPGDLICEVNGEQIYHPLTLRGMVVISLDSLDLTVWRSGEEKTLKIPPLPID